MSTFTQNNLQQLFVGGTADKTAAGGLLTAANEGEICILSADGTIMSEADAAAETHFKIGLNRGSGVDQISDIIEKSKISFCGLKTYAAAQEQISYIGFNGTSGSIAENDNDFYYVRIYVEEGFNRASSDAKMVKWGQYRAGTSTTQELIAAGITQSLINNFSRDAERKIKFERVTSDAGDASTGTGAVTFTYGSKTVSAATDIDAVAAVGDYLRVGTTPSDPVYKIVSMDTTADTAELDIAFQGDSGAVTVEVVTAADAAAGDFGIKLTGLPLDYKLGKIKYKKMRWETQVDRSEGFGENTLITNSQAASPGTGTVQIVEELEWFTQGHEGEIYRMGEPLIYDSRKDTDSAVAGGGYDLINISFVDDSVVGFQPNVSPKLVTLAIPATGPNYAVTGTADDITDVLEVLAFGSANGNLAVS